MKDLVQLRKIYGSVYLTILPDGTKVPWKPLSVQEFLEYESLRELNAYPIGCLEDEIFKKCVLDSSLVDVMDDLKAGIVSAVAATIMAHSGPQGVEDLTVFMNINRMAMQGIIHKFVRMVCWAFPGYKPEDVYAMDYVTLMQRVALAEEKLLEAGLIGERLTFSVASDQQQSPQQRPRVDSKELFERQQRQRQMPNIPAPAPGFSGIKQTIITGQEIVEHNAAYTGHEQTDKILLEHKMVEDTAGIYQDYVQQMKDGKKVTIPSHEERLRAAKLRVRQNALKYKEEMAKNAEANKKDQEEELKKLLEIREKARARKNRKRRK